MGDTFLYYAYGSNLLKQRLLLNNPTAKYIDVAKLEGYRLTFDFPCDPKGKGWMGASATIREAPGESLWGTVWKLDMSDSAHLDRQERCYKQVQITARTADDRVYTCRTYEMDGVFNFAHTPSPQYKDVIVRGARQSGLPTDYIEKLEAIEDNGFSGDVPLYNEVIQNLEQTS